MKCCVSTDVGTRTNWLTFEPDPDYSPDAGTGLLSPMLYALQRGILLRRENPTYRYWAPVDAATRGFIMVLFTASRENFVGGTCAPPSALLVVRSCVCRLQRWWRGLIMSHWYVWCLVNFSAVDYECWTSLLLLIPQEDHLVIHTHNIYIALCLSTVRIHSSEDERTPEGGKTTSGIWTFPWTYPPAPGQSPSLFTWCRTFSPSTTTIRQSTIWSDLPLTYIKLITVDRLGSRVSGAGFQNFAFNSRGEMSSGVGECPKLQPAAYQMCKFVQLRPKLTVVRCDRSSDVAIWRWL